MQQRQNFCSENSNTLRKLSYIKHFDVFYETQIFRSLDKISLGIWHVTFTKEPGKLLPISLKKRVLKVEEKSDHVNAEAQVEHERMDNNAEEWKTNEWKFPVGNVAIAGKRITKTNGKSPFAKIPISHIARLRAQENT